MNVQSIRERIGAKFGNVQEMSSGVLRSVRRQGESAMAVYLFDLNNRVQESAAHLDAYLDDVLGPSYFDEAAPADLRWNHYLYLVADRDSASGGEFEEAKRRVEANKSYARKFVIAEDELDGAIARIDSVAEVSGNGGTSDVVQVWTEKLVAAGLRTVLDPDRAVADVVRIVASKPAKDTTRARRQSGTGMSELLASAALASVDLSQFREHPIRKSFENLGRANLIVGVNGVGKTSFLEGLEFLYCGGNRRSASSAIRRVQGTLTSGAQVFTASSQKLSDFKTRQRLWYGGDDATRRNLLPNQFGRFNFLNTDAAAELTLLDREKGGDSPVRGNLDSLAALLSGDEATDLWRRIQAVNRAVAEEKRKLESDRHAKQADRREADAERKKLEASPQQSDAAFAVLVKDLAAIAWSERPAKKGDFSRDLLDKLSLLASKLGPTQQVTWTNEELTPGWLVEQRRVLTEAVQVLRQQAQRVSFAQQRIRELEPQLGLLEARLAALESLDLEAVASLAKLTEEHGALQRELVALAGPIGALEPGQELDIAPPQSEMMVSVALADAKKQLQDARVLSNHSQRALTALRRNHSELEGLGSQLRELVEGIFNHGHSRQDCPVCGSHFNGDELTSRIQALALASDSSALTEAQRAASLAKQQVDVLAETLSRLERVEKFCLSARLDSSTTTVLAARDAIDRMLSAHQKATARRADVARAIEDYSKGGLTIERVRKLCVDESASKAQAQDSTDVRAAVERVRAGCMAIKELLAKVTAERDAGRAEAQRALALVDLPAASGLDSALNDATARLDIVAASLEACEWVGSIASIDASTSLRRLNTGARAAVMSATSLAAALDAESQSTDRLAKVQGRLQRLDETLLSLNESIGRLAAAGVVLSELVEKYSLEAATQAAITATHEVADEIFARIHMPAEYRIATQGELPLVRRSDGQAKELSQVSTGQRAAYALSMFLAMNAQVRGGPRALILDDPISHIDDLNALSFLDYLRNLVLHSQRQLFFATADEKMAGLFAHKFAFLGKDFRTIELKR